MLLGRLGTRDGDLRRVGSSQVVEAVEVARRRAFVLLPDDAGQVNPCLASSSPCRHSIRCSPFTSSFPPPLCHRWTVFSVVCPPAEYRATGQFSFGSRQRRTSSICAVRAGIVTCWSSAAGAWSMSPLPVHLWPTGSGMWAEALTVDATMIAVENEPLFHVVGSFALDQPLDVLEIPTDRRARHAQPASDLRPETPIDPTGPHLFHQAHDQKNAPPGSTLPRGIVVPTTPGASKSRLVIRPIRPDFVAHLLSPPHAAAVHFPSVPQPSLHSIGQAFARQTALCRLARVKS